MNLRYLWLPAAVLMLAGGLKTIFPESCEIVRHEVLEIIGICSPEETAEKIISCFAEENTFKKLTETFSRVQSETINKYTEFDLHDKSKRAGPALNFKREISDYFCSSMENLPHEYWAEGCG